MYGDEAGGGGFQRPMVIQKILFRILTLAAEGLASGSL